MIDFFTQLSPFKKNLIYALGFLAVFGAGVYWFYSGNKATIVKIKYQGTEGLAILSSKQIEDFGNGLKYWTAKRTFHINLLHPTALQNMQSKIKSEFNELEQRLETVVEVSKSIWKKYHEGDTLRIKYLPSDPVNYVMVLD
ncbi:MAG: hypothetical protein AAFO94_19660 [Bacteroidota bacterium]